MEKIKWWSPGDRVRCIRGHNPSNLCEGHEYKVEWFAPDAYTKESFGGYTRHGVFIKGVVYRDFKKIEPDRPFFADRFELIEPEEVSSHNMLNTP